MSTKHLLTAVLAAVVLIAVAVLGRGTGETIADSTTSGQSAATAEGAAGDPTDVPEAQTATAGAAENAAPAREAPVAGRLARLTPDAAARGWQLFLDKRCIDCHAVWGRGGDQAPDLGAASSGAISEGRLAAALWNHGPRMWTKIEDLKLPVEPISNEEMEDIFSFFFYVRNMDAAGDPRLGRLAMLRHGCRECHQVSGRGGDLGPDLSKWARYTNPVLWVQKMWEAGPAMREAMKEKGMEWPVFAPGEITDMIAYVRSVSPSSDKIYLQLGVPADGARLLQEKRCLSCHEVGGSGGEAPDLASVSLPGNIAEAAVNVLNHLPAMLTLMGERGIEPQHINAQEMAHIVTYLLSQTYIEKSGNAEQGEAIFTAKGCIDCHGKGTQAAPALATMHAEDSAAYFSHAVWNSGQKMLKELIADGQHWPTLTHAEMLDVLAYMRSSAKAGPAGE